MKSLTLKHAYETLYHTQNAIFSDVCPQTPMF